MKHLDLFAHLFVLFGLLTIIVALYLVNQALGLIALGVVLCLIGYAMQKVANASKSA